MRQVIRLTAVIALLTVSLPTFAETIKATMYKSPQ
jgi:hypothetical protein